MSVGIILRVRDQDTSKFIDNFHQNRWKVRYQDPETGTYKWIRMTPKNTRVLNPEHDPNVHSPMDPLHPKWLVPLSE